MRRYLLPAFLASLLLLLAACAPAADMLRAPRIQLTSFAFSGVEASGLTGSKAVFMAEMRLDNPNPFAVGVAGLDLDLALEGRRVAGSSFRSGLDIPANGSAPLILDIEAPLLAVPQLAAQVSRLASGQSVAYRLDATLTAEVLGSCRRRS